MSGVAVHRVRQGIVRRTMPAGLITAVVALMCLLTWSPIAHARNVPQAQNTADGTPHAQRSCASYPTPGTLAPSDTQLPTWLLQRYSMLKAPQRRIDTLPAADVSSSLTASGLVLGHSRYLGRAAFGGRVYLVPAEHLLAFRLAPARCLPASEQSLEKELAPQLRSQYRHWALCIVVLHSSSGSPTCGAAGADPEALLFAAGTPGFGLVRDGVPDVTLYYLTAPAMTVKVHQNFYLVDEPKQSSAPCSVQWENATGNVNRTFAGCDYSQLLNAPLQEYRSYVRSTLQTLSGQVDTLIAAIDAGDLSGAEADWLTAHESWLDIGQDDGPYSAYGDLGLSLDGTAAGQPLGTADPDFTGFHKVELDLWQNHDLATAATDATQLAKILGQIIATPLSTALPDTNNGLAAWVLRPHETLEDALRDTLSGDDDYGSGTGVATIVADVAATREFLTVLAPVLGPLAPGLLPRARADLEALETTCTATEVNGEWVAVSALSSRQRELIDADAGTAAELLDHIPNTLTNVGTGAPST